MVHHIDIKTYDAAAYDANGVIGAGIGPAR